MDKKYLKICNTIKMIHDNTMDYLSTVLSATCMFFSVFISLPFNSIALILNDVNFYLKIKNDILRGDRIKYDALSLLYINNNSNIITILFTVLYSIVLLFIQLLLKINTYSVLITSILFITILFAKDFTVKYRIRKGLFGTKHNEARELIDFIIKNSDNLDFTDSNGNLRRALLPEAKDAVEEHIPGTLGEEARA